MRIKRSHVLAVLAGGVVASLAALPVLAATANCNGGATLAVFIDITTTSGSPSCDSFGNGTVLNTLSDPRLARVLDTTQTGVNGTPTLTVNFVPEPILGIDLKTDGSFSFNTAGYKNFFLGFQLNDRNIVGNPGDLVNPDWFVFSLAGILTGSGTFDADLKIVGNADAPSDAIKYVVLYGEPSQVPLPGAVWLFGSVLGGWVGFQKWRNRCKASLIAAV